MRSRPVRALAALALHWILIFSALLGSKRLISSKFEIHPNEFTHPQVHFGLTLFSQFSTFL